MEGFRFEFLWNDNDVFQLRIRAWNGNFGGTADVYVPIGAIAEAAEKLEGFPRHTSDKRDLQFGEFGPEWAGGAVSMRFFCKGAVGRTFVEATVESGQQESQPAERAHFVVSIEPSAVDDFVAGLRRLGTERRGTACLNAAISA